MIRYTYFKSSLGYGWAVFDNLIKKISHYEETEREAFKTCMKWNHRERMENKNDIRRS